MQPDSPPEIGGQFNIAMRDGYITTHGRHLPNPYIHKTYAGIQFKLAVDHDEKLVYLATDDPKFRTPEGLRIKASFKDVLAAGGQAMINEEGFHPYSKLPSGWCAAFPNDPINCFGPALPGPNTELLITEFFKR